ncbi:MAG: hypothetical protein PHP45_06000 [Elusimicrobiales bacterium]|nr:hypothetical protein [Elusimicrobiales bacterium]
MKLFIPLAALLALSCSASYAERGMVSEPDRTGASYSVSNRYNNRNDYLHIAKMDYNGSILWEANYDTAANLKPAAVVVHPAGIIILAAHELNGRRSFVLINYSSQNYLVWDRVSDAFDSIPVALALDANGNICVCGNSRLGNNSYQASLWKYNPFGTLLWHVDYSGGGNTYARQLQTLFNDDIALGITVSLGSDTYGQYERHSVTYTSAGALRANQ